MPELPEVETTLQGLLPLITNKKISAVNIHNHKLRWGIPWHLNTTIDKKTIINIKRRSKYLLIHFDTGMLIIHLGMSGSIRIVTTNTPLQKHDHFELCFDNNTSMRLNDPRRFGCVLWSYDKTHPLLKNLAIEPLKRAFNGDYLHAKSQKRKCSIKAFITNNKIVAGVGNIYACESLFMARISPQQKANDISKKRYQTLTDCIKKILNQAIKAGGTTLQDFSNVDGNPGYFSQSLSVYKLEGKPCKICNTKICKITQNQRSTFFCKSCQV